MSKFTIIGDPHATNKNLDKIETLFNLVEDLGFPAIWLGDFLDTKEVIRGKCLNLLYQKFKDSKLRHIVLIGNHDWFNLECQDHALQVLKELPNVTIVDEPMVLEEMWFTPYYHDTEKLKEVIENCAKGTCKKVLFGHFDIIGFDYGNGFMCDSGLFESDFSSIDFMISGHFHKYQREGNRVYLGTPFSHSFGESNQKKYIGIFDSDALNLELIETPFPSHRTIEIDCDGPDTQVETYKEEDHLRVIFKGSKESILKVKSQVNYPETTKIIEKPNDEYANTTVIDETLDNVVKFKQWANEVKGLNEDAVKLGTQILEALRD